MHSKFGDAMPIGTDEKEPQYGRIVRLRKQAIESRNGTLKTAVRCMTKCTVADIT